MGMSDRTETEKIMKETIYTIPLMDALQAQDECPFCFVERKSEQDALDGLLGSSSAYMKSEIREQTNKQGFCRAHYKKMFDYGNSLGCAIILQSHFQDVSKELNKKLKGNVTVKAGLFKKKKGPDEDMEGETGLGSWLERKRTDCYICTKYKKTYQRYMETFFYLLRTEEEFYRKVKDSKGFCLFHLEDLANGSKRYLNGKEQEDFQEVLRTLMSKNMERLQGDIDWFIEKFDYQNREADWKNSRDAVPRCMQKLAGGYPQDPPYESKK